MKQALFEVGDWVRVKSLDTLKNEFSGDENFGFDTPCSFTPKMTRFCGSEMQVESVYTTYRDGEPAHYYDLVGGDNWNFDECVLEVIIEDTKSAPVICISYDELF